MKVDTLKSGSCFNIYSSFNSNELLKFDFRTKTVCNIECINAEDLIQLENE